MEPQERQHRRYRDINTCQRRRLRVYKCIVEVQRPNRKELAHYEPSRSIFLHKKYRCTHTYTQSFCSLCLVTFFTIYFLDDLHDCLIVSFIALIIISISFFSLQLLFFLYLKISNRPPFSW